MTRSNVRELLRSNHDGEFIRDFGNLYQLSHFFSRSLFCDDYSVDPRMVAAIRLSGAGQKIVDELERHHDGARPEIMVAIFRVLFHHDLYIDVKATDAQALLEILNSDIVNRRIRFPWIFERLLYDRFFELFSTETDRLGPDETRELLDETPQGVFQLNEMLLGPFGVLQSEAKRFFPVTSEAKLWHCSDISCSKFHYVRMKSFENKIVKIEKEVLRQYWGSEPPSEWDDFYAHACSDKRHYDDLYPRNLLPMLADGFADRELRCLLAYLVDESAGRIRKLFPKNPTTSLTGPGRKIAENLNKPELTQLILLADDEVIIASLEKLVDDGAIQIPALEIRVPRSAEMGGGWLRMDSEFSRSGWRTVARNGDISYGRLHMLLHNLYAGESGQEDLAWHLRHLDGRTPEEKLERYVRGTTPPEILQELIFAGPTKLRKTCDILRYGHFEIPKSKEEEKRLRLRLLWKLGFDVGRFPHSLADLLNEVRKLREVIEGQSLLSESLRTNIRSIAVNLFVELEAALDRALAFSAWILLSDHYGITSFCFEAESARRVMVGSLRGLKGPDGKEISYNEAGINTLYPLVQGFSLLASVCESLIRSGADSLLRPPEELPSYHDETELEKFPFLHKVLLLDLSVGDRSNVVAFLKGITMQLVQDDVCSVRNRLEHSRSDFPSPAEIKGVCIAIESVLDKLESTGLYPNVYELKEQRRDVYKRRILTYQNCCGREIQLNMPSRFSTYPLPSLVEQQVLVPFLHIGDSLEFLRFRLVEPSAYTELWENYPRRRTR